MREFCLKWTCVAWVLWGVSLPTNAAAVGLGPFFEYGRGIGVVESGRNLDYDTNRYSVGFALDTAVARDTLFNYRLNLGYSYRDQMFDGGGDSESHGLTLNNMFGFGVYRSDRARLWLGPSIRFNADFVTDLPSERDVVDLGIGGGLALGANIHTGAMGSVGLTFGYQYLYVASVVSDSYYGDETLHGRQHLISFNLTYFFRLRNDKFGE